MGYLGRRIGLSQDQGNSNPSGADGAVGGGILDLIASGYFQRQGNVYNAPGITPTGLTASGGVINDFAISGTVYRAHIFTSTGPFNVTALSTDPNLDNNIDYLVVAGGGGGGAANNNRGGGGGAGGLRSNFPTIPSPMKTPSFTASVQDYAITVGAGGVGAMISGAGYINPGSNSSIGTAVVASGGAGGGNRLNDPAPGTYPSSPEMAGGSGGGGGSGPGGGTGGPTVNSPDPLTPQAQGNAGGNGNGSDPNYGAGGGGGAGAAGGNGSTTAGGAGGNGLQVLIAGPPASDQPVGTPGTNPGGGYFAGGGGGGVYTSSGRGTGGDGGGGDGGNNPGETSSTTGTQSTGGGGGGNHGKSGGSGIVVIRYKIGSVQTKKATGGAISFYGGKTIHAFTSSGIFEVTGGPISAEFFIVAGGGGGGYDAAGGGGAGGVVYHPGLTVADGPYAVTVGGGGAGSIAQPARGDSGVPSSIAFPTTYAATGGGGGGSRQQSGGGDGGSGGGGGRQNGNGGNSEQPSSNPGATEYGNSGGDAGAYAGGGGGAGSAGQPYPDQPNRMGWGGTGIQAPTTFRDPNARYGGAIPGGDPSGNDWGFAGGGGGGGFGVPEGSYGGSWTPSGRIPGGPYYGGGSGALDPPAPTTEATIGLVNSGGGGGGGNNSPAATGARGGSGIVLIAYPT